MEYGRFKYICVIGALCALLCVSACGFSPVYGTLSNAGESAPNNVAQFLQTVDIARIPNREGQYLRNALVDRFYFNDAPVKTDFVLSASPINQVQRRLDITRTSDATREELTLSTTIKLRDNETKEVLLTRIIEASTSYNVLSSEFSTRVSEDAARINMLDELAREIEQTLALYVSSRASL